jgi:tetratricopeptide (TPR) repeat protein
MLASRLAWLYQRHKRFEEANGMYRQIWESWVNISGHLDEQTILAAGDYSRALQLVDENQVALEVYEKRFEAASNDLERSDHEYVAAVIALAEAYELIEAEDKSESLIVQTIQDATTQKIEDAVLRNLIELRLALARLYNRHSRTVEYERILREQWSQCKTFMQETGQCPAELLAALEEFGLEIQGQRLWHETEELVSWCRQYYERTSSPISQEVLHTMYWSAQISKEKGDFKAQELQLKEVYDLCKSDGWCNGFTIESNRQLGLFYYSHSYWKELQGLCLDLLERLWPSVVTTGPQTFALAFSSDAVQIARRLAMAYQRQEPDTTWYAVHNANKRLDRAEQLYENIFASYRTELGLEDPQTIGTANELGRFYESRGKIDLARALYTTTRQSIQQNLSPSHHLAIQSGLKLAKTYEMEKNWPQAEKVYQELVEVLSKDWGVGHQSTAEMIINLSNVCKRQGKELSITRECSFTSLEVSNAKQARSAQSLDDHNLKRNLAVEYKLSDIELKEPEESGRHDEAYHFCQQQYNKLLELVGTENKLTHKARLRFGALLERQGRPTEAMELYKDMLGGCGSSDFAQFPSLQYDTTKRLTRLYESREDKGQLIKDMYIRSWDRTKRLEDALRKESYRRIFRDLFCCLKDDCRDPQGAQAFLEDVWDVAKGRNRDSESFWATLGTLALCYSALDRGDACIRMLEDADAISEEGEIASRCHISMLKYCTEFGRNGRADILQLRLRHQTRLGPQQATKMRGLIDGLSTAENESPSWREHVVKLLQASYEDWETKDPVHENTRRVGQELATTLGQLGRHKEQEELLRRMWETCKKVLGEANAATIVAANALAESLGKQGQLEEKEDLLRQIWARCKSVLGETDAATISAGKAVVYKSEQSRRETTAKSVLQEMLSACWTAEDLGPTHSTTWELANTLAREILNDHEVRLLAHKLYLDLRAANVGGDSGLRAYNNLLRGDGLYLSAPGYGFSRAWSRGAPRRPNTEFTEEDMNETLRQGKEIYEHYLDLECRINGPFKSLSHMHYYAEFLKELNRPEEACAVFEKAWEMRPSRTSWDQKAISSIGLSLAKAYYGLGRQIEAIDLLTTICDHDELAYGCTDKTSLESLNQLSRYFSEQKKYQLALDIHNKVLAAADVAFFGISSVDISPRNLRRAGRGSAAAYRSGRLLAPPGHSVVIEQFNMKGRALQRLGRWDEARSVYDEAFQKCNSYYGPRGWYPRKADNIRAWDGEVGRYLMGVSVRARVSP